MADISGGFLVASADHLPVCGDGGDGCCGDGGDG